MDDVYDDELVCADCGESPPLGYWENVRLVIIGSAPLPVCPRCWEIRQVARLN